MNVGDVALLVARFRRLFTPGENQSCWEWLGARNEHGYGLLGSPGASGPPIKAHRLAVALDGRDPTDLVVEDGRLRGSYRGERNGASKLTADAVRIIRTEASRGTTQRVLAERFGVGQQAISDVVTRRRWAHVD